MQLWEYIKSKMMTNPTQTVCEENAQMTYEELVVFAELFAKRLDKIQCCAILCRSEMAAAMALLGCFAAEVTAVPLSLRYGELHCNHILDTICPQAVITDEDGVFQVQMITDSAYVEPKQKPALLMCTSGTTGKPKGVMLSQKNIRTNVKDIAEYFEIDKNDSLLIARPLYHCAVLTGEFLTGLVKGCKIRFYSELFHPIKLLELIRIHKITAFCGTPTLLNMMARLQRPEMSCELKQIGISGECMDKELGERIAKAFPECRIYHNYGLTEASPRVSFLPPKAFSENSECVGIPLKSVSVRLVNKDGKLCGVNEEGILWVKGKNVMLGYYNDAEKTAEILKDGWLCTGDVAVMTEAGYLKIKGRNDDLIIKAGMNIYPAEIEAVLKLDDRTADVMVYAYESRHGTQIGMKIVGEFHSVDEVVKLCIESLPSFQVPTQIDLVEELPQNASGKLIRKK